MASGGDVIVDGLEIDIQYACAITTGENLPDRSSIHRWLELAYAYVGKIKNDRALTATQPMLPSAVELCIRIVDHEEGLALNQQYRGRSYATNVLSFTCDLPATPDRAVQFLGDIVLCRDVVEQEAAEQQKCLIAHWAHLMVHGLLHLLGYDHIESADAAEMEAIEISILAALGWPDPYQG